MSEEIIYFDDNMDWVKEYEQVTAPKKKSKPKIKPHNEYIPKKRLTLLGMDEEDTETAIAVILGSIFMILLLGSLIGYMIWYFNQ